MKFLSIRLDDSLGKALDEACRCAGYKKNTLVTRLIESFVRHRKAVLRSRKGRPDPFEEAVGLMNIEPFLDSPDEIDRIIYDS